MFQTVTELYRELTDLPHATKGDPEDADTTASDHASDALRYLLTNLGTGPEFPILEDLPKSRPRPSASLSPADTLPSPSWQDDGDWWNSLDDDDGPQRGGTVTLA
jgi:hypothetical protein